MEYSELESKRFSKRIYRDYIEDIDVNDILLNIFEQNIDILIIRLNSEKINQISILEKLKIPYLVADTLVCYYVDLDNYEPNDLKNSNLKFIKVNHENINILDILIDHIFINYQNHYSSNPYLQADDILEGYKEWARSYVSNEKIDRICWIVNENEKFVGFATCSYDKDTNEAEVVLNGVLPSASGKGIYGDIIRYTQMYFKSKKYKTMKVSTQVQNFAVQKVWNREGFFMKKALNTIHINSLANYSIKPKKEFIFSISENDLLNLSHISQNLSIDKNLNIKSDTDFSIEVILTDLIIDKFIIDYFKSLYPNKRFIIKEKQSKFLSSVKVDFQYKIIISWLKIIEKTLFFRLLIKVLDKNSNIIYYSYYSLIVKE